MALALAACSQTTISPSGSPTPGTRAQATANLPCSESIAAETQPYANMTVVLGVVALPTSDHLAVAMQTFLTGDREPRLFAKWGLEVKAGAHLELVVPNEVASGFSVGWGSAGLHRTLRLVDEGCGGSTTGWLAYAGGYYVQQVGCMPLIVRTAGQEQRVTIGVGAACPGQAPPHQPTDT